MEIMELKEINMKKIQIHYAFLKVFFYQTLV